MSFAEIFIVPVAIDYQNSPFEPIFDGVPPADGGFGNSDRPQFPSGSSNDVQNVDECLLVELDNDNLEGLLSLVPTEDASDDEQAQNKALLYSEPIPRATSSDCCILQLRD